MNARRALSSGVCVAALLLLVNARPTIAQPAPSSSAPPVAQVDKPPLKAEELEQLLAPIALYPDSLLTQMLMASTYPLEIVQADRWVKQNKNLTGDALAAELEKQPWDPSVKSLVNFPDQLSLMSDQLDLTIKIGDAFLEQQSDVMNTIQVLRNKAQANGTLKSDTQQTVDVQPAPPPSASPDMVNSVVVNAQPAQVTIVQAPPQIITIVSPSPQIVYVPTYNPMIVYGAWPYPAYPPYPYYPPRPVGFVISSNGIFFGIGTPCGVAWGYAWGSCNWGHQSVKINVNQNININNNYINRGKYEANYNKNTNINAGGGSWRHDPAHRQGVAYPNQRTSQQYRGANSSPQAVQAREDFRGRAAAGREDLNRGSADQFKGNQTNPKASNDSNRAGNAGNGVNRDNAGANRPAGGANQGNAGANRPAGSSNQGNAGANRPAGGSNQGDAGANRGGSTPNRDNAAANRGSSGSKGGAFDGSDAAGKAARDSSQRGAASRSGGSGAGPPAGGGAGGRSGSSGAGPSGGAAGGRSGGNGAGSSGGGGAGGGGRRS
jgi:uncharacterized protein DUF3300